jgi:hypothetical protein
MESVGLKKELKALENQYTEDYIGVGYLKFWESILYSSLENSITRNEMLTQVQRLIGCEARPVVTVEKSTENFSVFLSQNKDGENCIINFSVNENTKKNFDESLKQVVLKLNNSELIIESIKEIVIE